MSTLARPEIAPSTMAPMRRLLKAAANARPKSCGFCPTLEIRLNANTTPSAIAPMMPTKKSTRDRITFRACMAPNAFRPRITRIAPTRIRIPPRRPMIGSHPMRKPTSNRSRPVFVRPICFCRSASQADGKPGIAPGYIGAAGGPPAPVPVDKALPQFTQNIVPEAFAAPQRGHVTLPANHDPLRPAMRESIEKDFEAGQDLTDVFRWAAVDGSGPFDRWISL